MGRIKSLLIKRTAKKFVRENSKAFNENFDSNKKAILTIIPSKRMRNSIAGYITRLKKMNK
ncbi:30S ribosomal protein S17e [Candidatus Pacearchaeota archaeon]|nr:30S ribosomal protein S17e [Candidatus Pacearchaeota archaeon]